MKTYFATPERADEVTLASEIGCVSQSPVVSGLLQAVGGLLAILNENLQVVAINNCFLQTLGVANADQVMGLRLGEAMHCVHAHEEPAGCGTTKYCVTCGAAISLVASLGQEAPAERVCALRADRNGALTDIVLLIRAQTIQIGAVRFILVFAQDITQQQQWAALERTFFHDVNNLLSMLLCASELLAQERPSELTEAVYKTTVRLSKEVAIQRCLAERGKVSLQPTLQPITVRQIVKDLRPFFANHPAAQEKTIRFMDVCSDVTVTTDVALLHRVLCNMIINAFEATKREGEVRVWTERDAGRLTFCVWNAQVIPEDVGVRIFQRNYSTKQQDGRGFGTYSMKLLGESILGGVVTFTSSPDRGTVFYFTLPLDA
jgi:signal transduction histidine kinase